MASYVSLLLALNSTTLHFAEPDRLNFAVEAVGQLMANYGGYCVFIGVTTKSSFNNALGDIMRHPDLQTFPRIILNRNFAGTYWGGRRPSLALVDDHAQYMPGYKHFYRLFYAFGLSTRVMIILDTTTERNYRPTVDMLVLGGLFNLVIVSTTEKRVLYFYRNDIIDLKYPPPSEELYKYQFRDMYRDYVTVTIRNIALGIYGNWDSPVCPAMNWVQETTKLLNGRVYPLRHFCRIYAANRKKCYEDFLKQKKVVVSLDTTTLEDSNRHNAKSFLDLSIPHSMTPLVPQPVPLKRRQLYGEVFQLKLWIFVATLMLCVELILVCRSQLSMFDFTLYALHGQQPADSLHVKSWQMVSLFVLIIIVFVLTIAFGANLYSLTMKIPLNPAIQTLDDLLLTNIKIKADLIQYPYLQEDPRFKRRISHHDIGRFELDGQHAYILETEMADLLQALELNYDLQSNRVRYRRLEPFNTDIQFRYVEDEYLFLEHFVHTERLFFETGIWNHWNDEFWQRVNGMMKPARTAGVSEGQTRMKSLKFNDLITAWLLLGIGLTVAFFVLFVEIYLYYCL